MKPWQVVASGMAALAVAMGIGRFAFTPILPMMLHDGVVDLATASWLASANYLGYLLGALLCAFQPWIWARLGKQGAIRAPAMVRAGLAATVVLTLGMAVNAPAAWPMLRFAAGMASAFVFVYISGWCLGQLARLGVPAMGAVIYAGPGIGIVLSGLAASGMVVLNWSAATGWLIFSVLAAGLTAMVWKVLHPRNELPPAATAAPESPGAKPGLTRAHGATGGEMALFALAYGIAGFGYIITATFLPVIARQALPGSPWLDLFWPIFGLGVIGGALIASRIRVTGDLRLLLAGCYAVQSLGMMASLVFPTLAGFAAGSLLLGLPFTAITFYAMQEVRRLRPNQIASSMGVLTVAYGLGQIVGPPLAAALLQRASAPAQGFSLSLEIAAGSLAVGVLMYLMLSRLYPMGPTS